MKLEAAEFEARLRRIGEERYHHRHPFNLRMHEGTLGRDEIQVWVSNRYYYQTRIPIKDGIILSKADDPDFRRSWVQRIHDHDGTPERDGGLALWLALAEAVGLERARVESLRDVLPGVREACDAYVAFVQSHDLLESVAASLTELFAGEIMRTRIEAFEKHYPWVDPGGLAYFRSRTVLAPRDAAFGIDYVVRSALTAGDQQRAVQALERKCEILWQLLDAIEGAFRKPRVASHASVRVDPLEKTTVVVLPERAVKLNESGREILALCDGKRSAHSIAAALRERHPDVERIETDVHDFFAQMERLGVLAAAP